MSHVFLLLYAFRSSFFLRATPSPQQHQSWQRMSLREAATHPMELHVEATGIADGLPLSISAPQGGGRGVAIGTGQAHPPRRGLEASTGKHGYKQEDRSQWFMSSWFIKSPWTHGGDGRRSFFIVSVSNTPKLELNYPHIREWKDGVKRYQKSFNPGQSQQR